VWIHVLQNQTGEQYEQCRSRHERHQTVATKTLFHLVAKKFALGLLGNGGEVVVIGREFGIFRLVGELASNLRLGALFGFKFPPTIVLLIS